MISHDKDMIMPHYRKAFPSRFLQSSDLDEGQDTDKWVGRRVRLVKGSTRYQGKRVACIDVSPSPAADGESVAEAVGF